MLYKQTARLEQVHRRLSSKEPINHGREHSQGGDGRLGGEDPADLQHQRNRVPDAERQQLELPVQMEERMVC